MSTADPGRGGHARASQGAVWERQAGDYHRFFSQVTIPVAHGLLHAAPDRRGQHGPSTSAPAPGMPPGPAARGWSPTDVVSKPRDDLSDQDGKDLTYPQVNRR
jgi:hypothetical protein